MKRLPAFFALRALEAAARHRSYSRAAEELAVTHSAVSQHIRALEADLGAKLFVRRGNQMEPTPAALELAGEVARATQILRDGVEAFAGAAAREPLILSVGGYMARRWLPPRLRCLLDHPAGLGVQIQVVDRHVDFEKEHIDAATRFGPGDWEGLERQRLFSEDIYPVCTPELARKHSIAKVEDLFTAPILHLQSRPWGVWLSKLGVEGPLPEGPSFDDSLMLMEAAAGGLGVALVVDGMVERELKSGRLVRPLGKAGVATLDIFLIWPKTARKLERIHALRDWFLAELEEEAELAEIDRRRG